MVQTKRIALRQEQSHSNSIVGVRFFYFCIKGVAGFVVPTQKIEYTQTHYLIPKKEINFEIFVNDGKKFTIFYNFYFKPTFICGFLNISEKSIQILNKYAMLRLSRIIYVNEEGL